MTEQIPMPIVFLDCETTSLHPSSGKIWEFAGIKRMFNGNGTIASEREMWFQIELHDLSDADPFALNIGKYWERYGLAGEWNDEPVMSDMSPEPIYDPYKDSWPVKGEVVQEYQAVQLIEEFTKDTTIIGNCISFDAERLDRLVRSGGRLPRWHYHIIDIEPLIVGYAKAKGKTFPLPYSSSDVSAWLGVEEATPEERHTAMGDARWVMRQWDALV